MPAPSKIDLLPDDMRRALDERIVAGGFGGYVALAEWLAACGYSIGKSALGVHGQRLERRLAAIRASTEAAKMIAAAAPDEADDRSNAIISMVQTQVFDALLALQDAEDAPNPGARLVLLGTAGKHIATLTRASVTRNKWAAEVRRKLDTAAAEVRKLAAGAGVSEETLAAIDARLMSVV